MSMHFAVNASAAISTDLDWFVAGNVTWMAWVKPPASWAGTTYPTAVRLTSDAQTVRIITKLTGSKATLDVGNTYADSTTNVATSGPWVHLCIRRTAANAHDFLVNGAVEATNAMSSTMTLFSTLYIGGIGNTDNDWLGDITQVRAWSTNLSDGEIAAEMASATHIKTASVFGVWPLANGTDASDVSGNNKTLTLNGTTTTGADDPEQGGGGGGPVAGMWLFS